MYPVTCGNYELNPCAYGKFEVMSRVCKQHPWHVGITCHIPMTNRHQLTWSLRSGMSHYIHGYVYELVWGGNQTWILCILCATIPHDDAIKWKHFPRYWHFVKEIHRIPVDSHHKGQWRRALMFSLIGSWTNGWVNNRDAADFRRHSAHYVVTVMTKTLV